MKRITRTREQVLASRAPLQHQLEERLAGLMDSFGLEDGYDWNIDDGDGLSNISSVVLRSTDLFSCDLVVGLARCLRSLSWDLFAAEDASIQQGARPIAMLFRWGAGPLKPTSREQAIIEAANAILKAEATACGFQDA